MVNLKSILGINKFFFQAPIVNSKKQQTAKTKVHKEIYFSAMSTLKSDWLLMKKNWTEAKRIVWELFSSDTKKTESVAKENFPLSSQKESCGQNDLSVKISIQTQEPIVLPIVLSQKPGSSETQNNKEVKPPLHTSVKSETRPSKSQSLTSSSRKIEEVKIAKTATSQDTLIIEEAAKINDSVEPASYATAKEKDVESKDIALPPAFQETLNKAHSLKRMLPTDFSVNPEHWQKKKVMTFNPELEGFVLEKGTDVYFIDPLNKLGNGAFKTVFSCYHIFENKFYAYVEVDQGKITSEISLKALKKEVLLQKQFRGETGEGVISSIKHVVKDHEGKIQGFILEYLNSGELWNVFTKNGGIAALSEQEIQKIVDDMAHGLEVLGKQENPVLHRDFKPQNVMLHRDDEGKLGARLIDFGLSTTVQDAKKRKEELGQNPSFVGTPLYMAPEFVKIQYQEASETDKKSFEQVISGACDVWALGITMFSFMKIAFPTFVLKPTVDEIYQTLQTIDDATVDLEFSEETRSTFNNNESPKTIDDVIRYAMAVDPAKRFTPAQVREHLNRLYSEGKTWKA